VNLTQNQPATGDRNDHKVSSHTFHHTSVPRGPHAAKITHQRQYQSPSQVCGSTVNYPCEYLMY